MAYKKGRVYTLEVKPPHIKPCSAGGGFLKILELYLFMLFNCLFVSIVRPNVLLSRPGRPIQEGDSFNLTCNITKGSPEPKISWFKDGNLRHEEKTTLILANVTDRDEGRYTCKAQNAGGIVTASIDITVKSKFIKIIMDVPTIESIRTYFVDFPQ